ncbi:unnamed protein product [Schistosoma rodhaini]|uniref:Uncharacterized protein n=1 Tax=Schistosoma rodhaini TaxID=6188 RepID=A0AA85G3R9_9TREM|nr:unnamed protein product [Schistosoma rodhaini]CAH8604233.1 unnamed protein product [Schistosoma rodhaini]
MVRGSARIKAGGINIAQDGPQIIKPLTLNMSLFQFLTIGYFEKDLLTYCANRLTEYSCIYWLDPTMNENSDSMELNSMVTTTTTTSMVTQFTNYSNYFINQTSMENITNLKTIQYINHNDTLNGTFIDPFHIHKSIKSNNIEGSATFQNHSITVIYLFFNKLIIPFILFGLFLNFILVNTILKLSYKQLPWLLYLFYIIILDQFDLIITIINFSIQSYYHIHLLIILQFLGRFYCQIIPMLYNLLKHLHSLLFIICAIETLKLNLNPVKLLNVSLKQTKQSIQNILILIFVIIIIFNCQFIWTFDLSKLDRLILHKHLLHNIYKCDFALTWLLSPIYLNYIWPIIDHIIGDLLPCFICLLNGIISYALYRLRFMKYKKEINNWLDTNNSQDEKFVTIFIGDNNNQQKCNQNNYLLYIKWIMKISKVFNSLCFIHGIFLIPRCLYYLMKYFFFISRITTRNNVHSHELNDFQSQTDQGLLNTINHIIELLRPYEMYLGHYESALCYINVIEIHLRIIILLLGLDEFKSDLYTYLSIVFNYFKRLSLCNLYGRKLILQNSSRRIQSMRRTMIDLPLDHKTANDDPIEMSKYLPKIKCNSDNLNSDDHYKQKKTSSFIECNTTVNSQTSLIADTQLNYTTYNDKCIEPDITKIDKFKSNMNIHSKYDWYDFKRYKSNDVSSSESFTRKYHIFYL